MSRNRNSAKQAGARFERLISDFLRDNLDDRIDRKVRTGARDTGDVANVRDSHNRRIVIEIKNYGGRGHPAEGTQKGHQKTEKNDAPLRRRIAKRRGTTNPEKQWAIMEVEDLIKLLKGPGDDA